MPALALAEIAPRKNGHIGPDGERPGFNQLLVHKKNISQ